jgi:hypothetical protein
MYALKKCSGFFSNVLQYSAVLTGKVGIEIIMIVNREGGWGWKAGRRKLTNFRN